MYKLNVTVFADVTEIDGVNDRGPWNMFKQTAEIAGIPGKAPSQQFEIVLQKNPDGTPKVMEAGQYEAILAPKQGRFRGSLDWEIKNYRLLKALDKAA